MYAAFVCLTEAVFRKLYKMDRYANSNWSIKPTFLTSKKKDYILLDWDQEFNFSKLAHVLIEDTSIFISIVNLYSRHDCCHFCVVMENSV